MDGWQLGGWLGAGGPAGRSRRRDADAGHHVSAADHDHPTPDHYHATADDNLTAADDDEPATHHVIAAAHHVDPAADDVQATDDIQATDDHDSPTHLAATFHHAAGRLLNGEPNDTAVISLLR